MKPVSMVQKRAAVAEAIRNSLGLTATSSTQDLAEALFSVLVVASRLAHETQRKETNGVNHVANAEASFKRFLEIRP